MYARRMDAVCVEIEHAAQKEDFQRIEASINDLKTALKETKDVVTTLLHSHQTT